jgi:hypothetical protein
VKWPLQRLLQLTILAIGLAALALLSKDWVLRIALERKIRSETGMDARISRFSSHIFSPIITIRGLTVRNTRAFRGTPFLDIPDLHVELDRQALRHGQVHVRLARLNLNELNIVRNELGQTNVLNIFGTAQAGGSANAQARKWLSNLKFTGIDVLDLTLGKTKYIDLQDPRNNRENDLQFQNQIFRNVKSEGDVRGILFMLWLRSGGAVGLR